MAPSWHQDYDNKPILKGSRLDKDVGRGNRAAWLENVRVITVLWDSSEPCFCCSDGWLGLGGSGGGVCLSTLSSNDAGEKGLSNWKTLVAQCCSGEEDDEGKTMEMQGALKGGMVKVPCRKSPGLGLVWKRENEEEFVYRGEGMMSLMESSVDFCSREISEFEKLSCLQTGQKWKHLLNMERFHHPTWYQRILQASHTYRLTLTLPVSHSERNR